MITSKRGLRVSSRSKLFLKLTTDGAIDYSEGYESHLGFQLNIPIPARKWEAATRVETDGR